ALLNRFASEIAPWYERRLGSSEERKQLLADLGDYVAKVLSTDPHDSVAQRMQATVWTLRGNLARDEDRPAECLHCREQALQLLEELRRNHSEDPELCHDYAIAMVLRGDCEAAAEEALRRYDPADQLLQELSQKDPGGRRANDDLGWSHLRLAAA